MKTTKGQKTTLLVVLVVAILAVLPALAASAESLGGAFEVKFAGVIFDLPAATDTEVPFGVWDVAGQQVNVSTATVVRLSSTSVAEGMWADVTAVRSADGTLNALKVIVLPPEVRIKGPIQLMPEGGIGTWSIAGQSIIVTEETRISDRSGEVAVDAWAEVFAIEDPAGTLTAVRMRGIEPLQAVELHGAIQSFGADRWTISSIAVGITDGTLISGEPAVGVLATGWAALNESDGLDALRIRVEWVEPGRLHLPMCVTGVIEALPEDGLSGTWTISGRAVEVTENTEINQDKGFAEIGARVQAVGWEQDGIIIAQRITVLFTEGGYGALIHIRGEIESMPSEGYLGVWVVAGQEVRVTANTRLEGARYAEPGKDAEVAGLRRQGGEMIATWLRVQAGSGVQPTTTPGPRQTPGTGPQPSRTPRS